MTRLTVLRHLLLPLLALLAVAAPAGAQVIIVEPPAATRPVRLLSEVVERGRYLLVDRDTLLPADFHAPGDLIIRDASVRLEGTVEGTVVLLGGTLFVRPGARITGPIAVVRGVALPSGLAEIGEIIEMPPGREARITVEDDTIRVAVLPPPRVAPVGLPGGLGVRGLSYDRVSGIEVSWGPQLRLAAQEFGPRLDVWASLASARRSLGGGAELRLPFGGFEAAAGAARATRTNEWWIRGDLANSLETLLFGRDERDYHESDVAWLRISRVLTEPLVRGEVGFLPYLVLRGSRDRSLEARGVWAFSGRAQLERPNLQVDGGTLLSAELGAVLDWEGRTSRFRGRALVENAVAEWGDFDFVRWQATGGWQMAALWNHSLGLRGHALGVFGGIPAPAQRWSQLGGVGTLPTLPVAALSGDRLVFIESSYRIPIPGIELPLATIPELELLHAIGTAWRSGASMPAWEQNLGVGLGLRVIRARVWIDPRPARPRPLVLVELNLSPGGAPRL